MLVTFSGKRYIFSLLFSVAFSASSQVTLFYQGFDTLWTTPSTLAGWTGTTTPANNVWHRNNHTSGWASGSSGAYTPGGANGTANSARFHSYSAAGGTSGNIITKLIDFSSGPDNKKLSFYYINKGSGSDELDVYISIDGGVTWSSSLLKLRLASSWTNYFIPLGRIASPSVRVKFEATSDLGSTDIGLDEISIVEYNQEYAALPYSQDFESAWINGNSLRDLPDKYWFNCPANSNVSARRQNDGSSAGWGAANTGTVSPSGSAGAADFHTYTAPSGHFGYLDLFVDMNQPGIKQLSFSYKNDSPADELTVLLSTDGGSTFSTLCTLATGNWTHQSISLGNTVASFSVIRFYMISDNGFDDIGLDDIDISNLGPLSSGFSFFKASPSTGNRVLLSWEYSRKNTAKFIIEESKSGSDFIGIKEVYSKGGSCNATIESFMCMPCYYRVSAVWTDGTIIRSEIRFVTVPQEEPVILPSREQSEIEMVLPGQGDYTFKILDLRGQVVYSGNSGMGGINRINVRLSPGLYFIVIGNAYRVWIKRFIY